MKALGFLLALACSSATGAGASAPTGAAASAPAAASITVEMHDFESDRGLALVALFTRPRGFPDGKYAAARRVAKISRGRARVVFDRLPPGTYAVAVLHDLDGDRAMDTNLVGAPAEGYGASNNARRTFGPPEWNQARFALAGGQRLVQKIRINH